jgi:DNA-binding MarR family transcriptional regulator
MAGMAISEGSMRRDKVERHLTYRLDTLSSSAIEMANEVYVRSCGLNVRELRILRLTDDNPGITFSDLAAQTRFERSLTSRLLSKLSKEGLIRRTIGKKDARQFNLHTTAKGHGLCEKLAVIAGEMEEHLLSPLSVAEREALHSSIQKLIEWVDGDGKDIIGQLFPPNRRGPAKKI